MKSFIILIGLFLAACGYRFEDTVYTGSRTSISVPYVVGDFDGLLTDEVIRQLAASGHFEYVQEGGSLILNIIVTADTLDKIGYRYDRKDESGKREKNLIPTESRRNLSAEICLVEGGSDEVLMGPDLVHASADFDYVNSSTLKDLTFINQEGKRETVIFFSLGQLDSIEGAQDDVSIPLFRHLAQKIVDGLINQGW